MGHRGTCSQSVLELTQVSILNEIREKENNFFVLYFIGSFSLYWTWPLASKCWGASFSGLWFLLVDSITFCQTCCLLMKREPSDIFTYQHSLQWTSPGKITCLTPLGDLFLPLWNHSVRLSLTDFWVSFTARRDLTHYRLCGAHSKTEMDEWYWWLGWGLSIVTDFLLESLYKAVWYWSQINVNLLDFEKTNKQTNNQTNKQSLANVHICLLPAGDLSHVLSLT